MKTQYKLCLIEAAYQTNLPEGWHVILNRVSGKLTAKLNCIIQKNDAKWSQAENQNALPELKIRLHEEICMMGPGGYLNFLHSWPGHHAAFGMMTYMPSPGLCRMHVFAGA
jgi:hypothetical protein